MIVFYADGSFKRGFGHLFRVKRIYENYFKNMDVRFLHLNEIQKNFYKKNNLNFISEDELSRTENKFNLFVVDSKKKEIKELKSFLKRSSKSIAIDSTENWVSQFDYLIFPSFYFDKDLINEKKSQVEIFYGRNFSIIPNSFAKNKEFKKILITFGGSDPNDLSSLVLDKLKSLSLLNQARLIVGPGFKKTKSFFEDKYEQLEVIGPVNETISYIYNSYIIFTALGTTIQEIEYLGKIGLILFNYDNDIHDFDMIRSNSNYNNNWYNLGSITNPNLSEITKVVSNFKLIEKSDCQQNQNWGSGWKEILNDLST